MQPMEGCAGCILHKVLQLMGSNGASPQVLSQERVPVGAGHFSIIHTKVSYKLEVGAEGKVANEIQNQRKKS